MAQRKLEYWEEESLDPITYSESLVGEPTVRYDIRYWTSKHHRFKRSPSLIASIYLACNEPAELKKILSDPEDVAGHELTMAYQLLSQITSIKDLSDSLVLRGDIRACSSAPAYVGGTTTIKKFVTSNFQPQLSADYQQKQFMLFWESVLHRAHQLADQ